MWEKIKSFSKMPLEQRYNIVLALVVVALGYIVYKQDHKLKTQDAQHKNTINSIVTRFRGDIANCETQLKSCNESYLLYLQTSEKEYRELLFEAKKLKEKIDEDVE